MNEMPCLIAYRVKLPNGRTAVAGKLLKVHDKIVFFRSHPLTKAALHKWHAISFDSRLLGYLASAGVREVHHRDGDKLWVIDLKDFATHAVRATHNKAEGEQHYVDLDHWRVISPVPYKDGHNPQEKLLTGMPWVPIAPPQEKPEEPPSPQGRLI